ncbi:hypothetical protein ACWC09_26655 [Streptomyces sp. NPDC001617]
MSRKVPPVIPVVGQGGDTSREEQLRKWEEDERARREQQAAAAAQPAAPVPVVPSPAVPAAAAVAAPVAVLPDPDAEPADQLAVCERGIHGAKARWTAKVEGANEAFIAEAGPYLAWVHENKLYKLMLDGAGKPYRSFAKYLKEQHDLSRRTGYRITQTIPLLDILKAGGHLLPDLSSRHVDALHPVRTQHGADAVLKVWETAWATKKNPLPTPEELEKAKQLLGLTTSPEADEEAAELTAGVVDPGAAVERAAKILVPETVREAARKDPDRIRGLVRVLNAALTEAGEPVD